MKKTVVVLGNNFGGLTAALSLKKELKDDVNVKVVSDRDYFLFNPSLIWLPFGKRNRETVSRLRLPKGNQIRDGLNRK